jgi:hypothetical protein
MPKLAAHAIGYFRARAGGAPEDETEEAKVQAFIVHCGQSLDWLFSGDPTGIICKAAGHSPQSASLAKPSGAREKAQKISSGLSDLETPFFEVRHLAYAARMMGSAGDMPKEAGAALDVLADKIVTMMDELLKERERLWRLAREAGDTAPPQD